MNRLIQKVFLACGLLLTLAAFPVFAQEKNPEINIMPFRDFTRTLKQQVDAGKIDLTKSFSVELEGVVTKDGRFDTKKSKFAKSEGDEVMIEAGKNFIIAVGDSGFLQYLKSFGVEKINLTLVQDEKQIYSNIDSELETEQRAKAISSMLNTAVQMVRAKKDEMKNMREDERILINGLTATSSGKTLVIKAAYEKSVIQELINRQLKEIEVKQSGE